MCAEQARRKRRNECQSGATLIELIAFIVIISIGLTGILLVMNQTVRASADPMQRKQAIAMAEAILEEILSKDATATLPETDLATCSNRRFYIGVRDYACFSGTPATAVIRGDATLGAIGNPLLAVLSATVAVANVTISSQSLVSVTVTVRGASDGPISITGYRAAGF